MLGSIFTDSLDAFWRQNADIHSNPERVSSQVKPLALSIDGESGCPESTLATNERIAFARNRHIEARLEGHK